VTVNGRAWNKFTVKNTIKTEEERESERERERKIPLKNFHTRRTSEV